MVILSLSGSAHPLVGWERERSILRQHLAAVMGKVISSRSGEAAIIKTTLEEVICREVPAQGAR